MYPRASRALVLVNSFKNFPCKQVLKVAARLGLTAPCVRKTFVPHSKTRSAEGSQVTVFKENRAIGGLAAFSLYLKAI